MEYCMHCMQKIMESDIECPFCGGKLDETAPLHHLLPGTILNKKFLVGKAIGQGGFGITYIGRDLTLDIRIAIKEYYPGGYVSRTNMVLPRVNCNAFGEDAVFFEKGKENFLKEAKILAKFSGEPGIVSVRDFFEENNTAYIVMEYVEGEDLKEYLKTKGKLSPEKTVEMMLPVMQALAKIHEQGMVHRDISPDNIRIGEEGVKLLDFGATRAVSTAFKKSLSVMLKPGYAPYEQYYSNGEQSAWTDVYSLCATMYHCITGLTPAEAPERLLRDAVKTPSALGITIAPVIEETLMKGLSVRTEDRFMSVVDLMRGFEGAGAGSCYEGTTLPNPSKHKEEEPTENQSAESIAKRIVVLTPEEEEEEEDNDSVREKRSIWKQTLVVVLFAGVIAIAVFICVWMLDLRQQMQEIGSMLSPTTEPTAGAELTATPGETKQPEDVSPEPTKESTPTPAATKTPAPTPTPAPVEFVRNEFTTGIELYPYDGEDVGYDNWMDNTELTVRIKNIPLGLTKGKFYCSIYVPFGSLQNGMYLSDVELVAGTEQIWDVTCYSAGTDFSIVDRNLVTRMHDFVMLDDGYLYMFPIEYDMKQTTDSCYVKIKFHSSTREGNGPVYFNNFYFKDEALGVQYVSLNEENCEISATHISGDAWELNVMEGETFWIYGID